MSIIRPGLLPLLLVSAGVLVLSAPATLAQDKAPAAGVGGKKELKSYEVPYKFTLPKHIVVRLKFNGKGPYNFILDTGAPALIVATKVGKQAGLKVDENGWSTIDKLEVEGGLVMNKMKARVETPFQLEGMNGMGLAGLEIHGLMGYASLAKYRMEIDFTKTKMVWTELDYTPETPLGLGGKSPGGQGGLEIFGSVMKTLGTFLGRRSAPEISLRGFFGMTLEEGDEHPKVVAVLPRGPAGEAGLQKGDVITKVQGRGVYNIRDMISRAGSLSAGSKITLTVQRGTETKEITFTISEGI